MLLSQNRTIFWDYIKNTKDKMKQLNINNLCIPDSAKIEIKSNCDKISGELVAMRILLVGPTIKSMEEWNTHKQNIAILQAKIADSIKQSIMANHAPVRRK